MSFRSDSISRTARSTRGNSWSGLNGVLVVILVIMLMQNPFGLALFVFGDKYYLMYLVVIFCFFIISSFARGRYRSVIYSTKYLRYYCAFVF
jgi:hypothetical protein